MHCINRSFNIQIHEIFIASMFELNTIEKTKIYKIFNKITNKSHFNYYILFSLYFRQSKIVDAIKYKK